MDQYWVFRLYRVRQPLLRHVSPQHDHQIAQRDKIHSARLPTRQQPRLLTHKLDQRPAKLIHERIEPKRIAIVRPPQELPQPPLLREQRAGGRTLQLLAGSATIVTARIQRVEVEAGDGEVGGAGLRGSAQRRRAAEARVPRQRRRPRRLRRPVVVLRRLERVQVQQRLAARPHEGRPGRGVGREGRCWSGAVRHVCALRKVLRYRAPACEGLGGGVRAVEEWKGAWLVLGRWSEGNVVGGFTISAD